MKVILLKPRGNPISVMSTKTTGIEPVFKTSYTRRFRDENEKTGGEVHLRRVIREIADS